MKYGYSPFKSRITIRIPLKVTRWESGEPEGVDEECMGSSPGRGWISRPCQPTKPSSTAFIAKRKFQSEKLENRSNYMQLTICLIFSIFTTFLVSVVFLIFAIFTTFLVSVVFTKSSLKTYSISSSQLVFMVFYKYFIDPHFFLI